MKFLTYGIFIVVYYCVRAVLVLPQSRTFYVEFLNVGQGDSIVINIPAYGKALVDTGFNYQSNYLFARSSVFPICQIKSLFITHYDLDHAGGLERITRYCKKIAIYDNLSAGDTLTFANAVIKILNPPAKGYVRKDNDDSLVMLLKKGGFSALLTGDAGLGVLQTIVPSIPAGLDVYKVSHHGSRHNTSYELLDQLKPKYCVISVGKNTFGHPTKEVTDALEKAKCKTFRTDLDGSIVLY